MNYDMHYSSSQDSSPWPQILGDLGWIATNILTFSPTHTPSALGTL